MLRVLEFGGYMPDVDFLKSASNPKLTSSKGNIKGN